MNKFILILGTAFLLTASLFANGKEEVIYSNDFNTPDSLSGWRESHYHNPEAKRAVLEACPKMTYLPTGGRDNSGCVMFESTDPACNFLLSLPLNAESFKGRGIILEGWMKAENLTEPALKYLGPKLMLAVYSNIERNYADQQKEYGTYTWKKFTAFYRAGDSVTDVILNIGMQGSTGKVWVDDIKVSLEPRSESDVQLKGQLPPNKTTQYRGVMSGYDLSEEAFRELREVWNANLLRFQIVQGRGDANSTEAGYRAIVSRKLAELDRVLPLAEKYGIKIVIDMHTGPATKINAELSNALSWDPAKQQLLVDVWREIATKYRKNPNIYGYDLLNEPREENYNPADGADDWNTLAGRIARAIREVDSDTPIIIEPAHWGGPAGLESFIPINVPKVIYSIHYYRPGAYTHQMVSKTYPNSGSYPGTFSGEYFDKARLEKGLERAIEFQKKYNVPIYVGEFGVARWAPNAEQYLDDIISIFEKYGWDWSYHSFREWDGWDAEIGSVMEDKKRIGDTPRLKVLLKYMKKNSSLKQQPKESGLSLDLTTIPNKKGQSVTQKDGVAVLELINSEVGGKWVTFQVDPAAIAGKQIVLSAEIAYDNISKAPNPWQGIKLLLTAEDDTGKKSYVQAKVGSGTQDWQLYSVEGKLPEKLTKATVVLGMEQVSGTVRYRDLKISIIDVK
ncbi:MAG: glycoside hydrolase family 5 protein [Victivallales bacterium]|jgi:hypothetical protein|nr:glycoside hydrolase family 5 protein [Victivallales bacterium]